MVVLLLSVYCFGADFGAVIGGAPEYDTEFFPGGGFADTFSVTGSAGVWVSGVIQDGLSYYVSGRVELEYEEDKDPGFLPELTRTELNWQPAAGLNLGFGRQRFDDAAAMAVSGLFDGLSGSLGFGWGRLSVGAYYTGFLYKEQAEILLTPGDVANYQLDLDYGNADSYFASRRILAALTAEFPDLSERGSLTLNVLAQTDVNGRADTLHSQYLVGRYSFRLIEALSLNVSGAAALIEEADTRAALAAAFGVDWEVPGAVQDLASVEARWSGGAVNDKLGAFLPLNSTPQGFVFSPAFSGLLTARASYKIRPHRTLSTEADLSYFMRTDRETFADKYLDSASTSRSLGTELSLAAVWAPDSALAFNAGLGAFFPHRSDAGGAFQPDAPIRLKATLGAFISF
jgi:hypothetical protein